MEDYEIVDFLGRGAFGAVQLAKRRPDGTLVVLKRVELLEEGSGAACATEVRALAACSHPLVVRLLDSFEHERGLVIAMEHVAGGTLRALLRRRTEPLPEPTVVSYLAQLVSALCHIHFRRLLHRDLTSRNVLLSADSQVVKIADLGLSKVLGSRCSRTSSLVGTPEYMSPELCRGEKYGAQSDVWALGCVLHELLTLRTPFQASSVPGLVLAILRGVVLEPPGEQYSLEVRHLAKGMLLADQEKRFTLRHVAASPSVATTLVSLATTLGAAA